MPTDTNNTSNNNTINKTHEEIREEGEEAPEAENTENTADATGENNVEDNKKLSEVTMAEQIRKTFNLTLKIPRILKGLHTNQFFFIQVSDHFYETNYPTLISTIADKKFGRFAGFKKGRFFVEKVVEKGGMDGWETEVTLNPIPPSLAIYSQKQKEAQKALMQAIKWENRGQGGTGGSSINASGNDCNPEDGTESHNWSGHRCKPPKCTTVSKTIHGNSSRQYAKDTAQYNSSSKQLVEYVKSQCQYQLYADNPYGAERCPEAMWTGGRPIRGNCADYARMLKCILDVNGYQSIICHIPGHFYNAIWENGKWTVCDLCNSNPYGHANHENEPGSVIPEGTWDNPVD